jgi:hypothetical protein
VSCQRKALGLIKGNPLQAHHLIPWDFIDNEIVQLAENAGFHMNDIVNGIPLPKNLHVEGMVHKNYNDNVKAKLLIIKNTLTNSNQLTPQNAKLAIENLINDIRLAIRNNPNVNINQLNF